MPGPIGSIRDFGIGRQQRNDGDVKTLGEPTGGIGETFAQQLGGPAATLGSSEPIRIEPDYYIGEPNS